MAERGISASGQQAQRAEHGIGGNALRAAVLGANDGLVSNLSLVMGVAGASLEGRIILLTGLAGLLAGALSMALGEWLSVQSARELYRHQIELEQRDLLTRPEDEERELAQVYLTRGLQPEQARQVAAWMMQDKDGALQAHVREELGVDPDSLGGSAWEAAGASFLLFAIGAILPVAPYALLTGGAALIASLLVSALGLFVTGASITLATGRNALLGGARQVSFGLAAAALTFAIGSLLGVSVGG